MDDTPKLCAYTLETELTGYMPLPRELTELDLPSTAVLIYAALLDRGTLSRKNGYADEEGRVYVIFPVERLAETFHISDTAVKRHLKELEAIGLIRRSRTKRHSPSHIYLQLPSGSIRKTGEGTNCPGSGAKTDLTKVMKVPPNNRRKQLKKSDYYQRSEEESL